VIDGLDPIGFYAGIKLAVVDILGMFGLLGDVSDTCVVHVGEVDLRTCAREHLCESESLRAPRTRNEHNFSIKSSRHS
jgi:hypothetical protein